MRVMVASGPAQVENTATVGLPAWLSQPNARSPCRFE